MKASGLVRAVREHPGAVLALLLAVAIVLSSLWGVYNAYSPVPYSDMWSGYVMFAERIRQGDWLAWWDWHNEHRLILPRLFFVADIWWAGGRSVLLIVAILCVQAVMTCLLYRHLAADCVLTAQRWLALAVSLAVPFCWVQRENFIWGFQIQFVLVYCLAFASFACAALPGSRLALTGAGVLGVLSAACMANGLLVLPMLVVLLMLARRPVRQWLPFVMLTGVVWTGYLLLPGQKPVADSGGLLAQLLIRPFEVLQFFLLYLGSPLRLPFGLRMLLGLLGLLLLIRQLIRLRSHRDSVTLSLCFLALFVIGSAALSAIGRAQMGIGQATASRYATPALLFWAAVFGLYWRPVLQTGASRSVQIGAALLLLVCLSGQLISPERNRDFVLRKEMGLLSLTVRAGDAEMERNLLEPLDELHRLAKFSATGPETYIMRGTWFEAVRQSLVTPVRERPSHTCEAVILAAQELPQGWQRVSGELHAGDTTGWLLFRDRQGWVIGAGLVGRLTGSDVGPLQWHGYIWPGGADSLRSAACFR